jgi:hypothetical protein
MFDFEPSSSDGIFDGIATLWRKNAEQDQYFDRSVDHRVGLKVIPIPTLNVNFYVLNLY